MVVGLPSLFVMTALASLAAIAPLLKMPADLASAAPKRAMYVALHQPAAEWQQATDHSARPAATVTQLSEPAERSGRRCARGHHPASPLQLDASSLALQPPPLPAPLVLDAMAPARRAPQPFRSPPVTRTRDDSVALPEVLLNLPLNPRARRALRRKPAVTLARKRAAAVALGELLLYAA